MVDPSADWTMQLSRGGLYLINNKTYLVFYAMEMKIHQHLTATSAPRVQIYHDRVHLIVLFYWTIVAAEWEEEVEKTFLHMICELWITIRGFSFADSWLEMYSTKENCTEV